MTVVTIHCRLIASESNRHQIWNLMADKNTPMVNEILRFLSEDEDFESWCEEGKLPKGLVNKICNNLKNQSRFKDQPGRFYSSAITLVEYMYKSYLRTQRQRYLQLNGHKRWFQMLKSDSELKQEAGCSLTNIRKTAKSWLKQHQKCEDLKQNLFDSYDSTEDIQTKTAMIYLLKNGCRIPTKPEDIKQFNKRKRKVQIKIERLQKRITDSIPPIGRELTSEKWLDILKTACECIPKSNEEAKQWQDQLLRQPKSAVPYPVIFNTKHSKVKF